MSFEIYPDRTVKVFNFMSDGKTFTQYRQFDMSALNGLVKRLEMLPYEVDNSEKLLRAVYPASKMPMLWNGDRIAPAILAGFPLTELMTALYPKQLIL